MADNPKDGSKSQLESRSSTRLDGTQDGAKSSKADMMKTRSDSRERSASEMPVLSRSNSRTDSRSEHHRSDSLEKSSKGESRDRSSSSKSKDSPQNVSKSESRERLSSKSDGTKYSKSDNTKGKHDSKYSFKNESPDKRSSSSNSDKKSRSAVEASTSREPEHKEPIKLKLSLSQIRIAMSGTPDDSDAASSDTSMPIDHEETNRKKVKKKDGGSGKKKRSRDREKSRKSKSVSLEGDLAPPELERIETRIVPTPGSDQEASQLTEPPEPLVGPEDIDLSEQVMMDLYPEGEEEDDQGPESGKICSFCACGRKSLLGQGDLCRYEPTPGFNPFRRISQKTSRKPSIEMEERGAIERGPKPLASRRQRSTGKKDEMKSPQPGEEDTCQVLEELSQVGFPEDTDVTTVFESTGHVWSHHCCAAWSEGVIQNEECQLKFVDKAVVSGLAKKCNYCSRYGATINCRYPKCSRIYHYPCASGGGCFQEIKSLSLLCPEHTDDAQTIAGEEAMCVQCNIVGNISEQLFCTSCGHHYHGNCLQPPVEVNPTVRVGWQCPDCKICQMCRQPGDDSKMLVCDVCDKGYHTFCLRPMMTTLPKNGWKCTKCRVCDDCGSRTPGSGRSSRWHHNYSVCDGCYQNRHKGLSCALCNKTHRSIPQKPMVQCNHCQKCVHAECDDVIDAALLQKVKNGETTDYLCTFCRNRDTEMDISSFPLAINPVLDNSPGSLGPTAKAFLPSETPEGTLDDSSQHSSTMLNLNDDSWSSMDLGMSVDLIDKMSPSYLTAPEGEVGLGRGKPVAMVRATGKQSIASKCKRSFGEGKRKRPLSFGEKKRHGPKPKALNTIGISSSNKKNNDTDDDDDDHPNTLVLANKADKFTLDQDICKSCGSFGKDEDGRMIACTQCGQCYHPYCANIKVTKIMIQKGWRCLDCTVCEGCGKHNDEGRLLLCDECDISYHTYCLDPPLDHVPRGTWKCKWCVMCVVCTTKAPGFGCLWQLNYTHCGPCHSKIACPLCRLKYKDEDLIIQCVQCDRWLHAVCDGIINEDDAERAADFGYHCALCRPLTGQVGPLPPLPPPVEETPTPGLLLPPVKEVEPPRYYMMDGVLITQQAKKLIEQTMMEATKIKRKRRWGKKPEDWDEDRGRLEKKIEQLMAERQISRESTSSSGPTPVLKRLISEGSGEEDEKDIDLKSPEGEPGEPDNLRQILEAEAMRMIKEEEKVKKRPGTKIGLGGFVPRPRVKPRPKKPSAVEGGPLDGGEDSQSRHADGEDRMPPSTDDDKHPQKKWTRKKQQLKILESFPSYMQEAFFGSEILTKTKEAPKEVLKSLDSEEEKPLDDLAKSLSEVPVREESAIEISADIKQQLAELPKQPVMPIATPSNVDTPFPTDDLDSKDDTMDTLSPSFRLNDGSDNVDEDTELNLFDLDDKFIEMIEKELQKEGLPESFLTEDDQSSLPPDEALTSKEAESNNQLGLDEAKTAELEDTISMLGLTPIDSKTVEDIFKGVLQGSDAPDSEADQPQQQISMEPPPPTAGPSQPRPPPHPSQVPPPIPQLMNDVPAFSAPHSGSLPSMSMQSPFPAFQRDFEPDRPPMVQQNSVPGPPQPSPPTQPQPGFPNYMPPWPQNPPDESVAPDNSRRNMQKWESDEDLGANATISPILYCNIMHPELKQQYPEWSERSKQIAKIWRKLTPDEKQPYLHKARKNRGTVKSNKNQPKLTPEQKRKKAEAMMPLPLPPEMFSSPEGPPALSSPNPAGIHSPLRPVNLMMPGTPEGQSPRHQSPGHGLPGFHCTQDPYHSMPSTPRPHDSYNIMGPEFTGPPATPRSQPMDPFRQASARTQGDIYGQSPSHSVEHSSPQDPFRSPGKGHDQYVPGMTSDPFSQSPGGPMRNQGGMVSSPRQGWMGPDGDTFEPGPTPRSDAYKLPGQRLMRQTSEPVGSVTSSVEDPYSFPPATPSSGHFAISRSDSVTMSTADPYAHPPMTPQAAHFQRMQHPPVSRQISVPGDNQMLQGSQFRPPMGQRMMRPPSGLPGHQFIPGPSNPRMEIIGMEPSALQQMFAAAHQRQAPGRDWSPQLIQSLQAAGLTQSEQQKQVRTLIAQQSANNLKKKESELGMASAGFPGHRPPVPPADPLHVGPAPQDRGTSREDLKRLYQQKIKTVAAVKGINTTASITRPPITDDTAAVSRPDGMMGIGEDPKKEDPSGEGSVAKPSLSSEEEKTDDTDELDDFLSADGTFDILKFADPDLDLGPDNKTIFDDLNEDTKPPEDEKKSEKDFTDPIKSETASFDEKLDSEKHGSVSEFQAKFLEFSQGLQERAETVKTESGKKHDGGIGHIAALLQGRPQSVKSEPGGDCSEVHTPQTPNTPGTPKTPSESGILRPGQYPSGVPSPHQISMYQQMSPSVLPPPPSPKSMASPRTPGDIQTINQQPSPFSQQSAHSPFSPSATTPTSAPHSPFAGPSMVRAPSSFAVPGTTGQSVTGMIGQGSPAAASYSPAHTPPTAFPMQRSPRASAPQADQYMPNQFTQAGYMPPVGPRPMVPGQPQQGYIQPGMRQPVPGIRPPNTLQVSMQHTTSQELPSPLPSPGMRPMHPGLRMERPPYPGHPPKSPSQQGPQPGVGYPGMPQGMRPVSQGQPSPQQFLGQPPHMTRPQGPLGPPSSGPPGLSTATSSATTCRPALLEDQPLLIQDLLEQEKLEQQKRQREQQAMMHRDRALGARPPGPGMVPMAPGMPPRMEGPVRHPAPGGMFAQPDMTNMRPRMPGPLSPLSQGPQQFNMPPGMLPGQPVQGPMQPPKPPNIGETGPEAERQQMQYELYLIKQGEMYEQQIKFLETQIQKQKRTKKAINARNRQNKKNGVELPPQDVMELERATQEQTGLQKQLEQFRKQNRQHQIQIQDYRAKHQTQQQQQQQQQQVIPGSLPSSTAMLSNPQMHPPRMPGNARMTPNMRQEYDNYMQGRLRQMGPGSMPPRMPRPPGPQATPPMAAGPQPRMAVIGDNNPFSDTYQQREQIEKLRETHSSSVGTAEKQGPGEGHGWMPPRMPYDPMRPQMQGPPGDPRLAPPYPHPHPATSVPQQQQQQPQPTSQQSTPMSFPTEMSTPQTLDAVTNTETKEKTKKRKKKKKPADSTPPVSQAPVGKPPPMQFKPQDETERRIMEILNSTANIQRSQAQSEPQQSVNEGATPTSSSEAKTTATTSAPVATTTTTSTTTVTQASVQALKVSDMKMSQSGPDESITVPQQSASKATSTPPSHPEAAGDGSMSGPQSQPTMGTAGAQTSGPGSKPQSPSSAQLLAGKSPGSYGQDTMQKSSTAIPQSTMNMPVSNAMGPRPQLPAGHPTNMPPHSTTAGKPPGMHHQGMIPSQHPSAGSSPSVMSQGPQGQPGQPQSQVYSGPPGGPAGRGLPPGHPGYHQYRQVMRHEVPPHHMQQYGGYPRYEAIQGHPMSRPPMLPHWVAPGTNVSAGSQSRRSPRPSLPPNMAGNMPQMMMGLHPGMRHPAQQPQVQSQATENIPDPSAGPLQPSSQQGLPAGSGQSSSVGELSGAPKPQQAPPSLGKPANLLGDTTIKVSPPISTSPTLSVPSSSSSPLVSAPKFPSECNVSDLAPSEPQSNKSVSPPVAALTQSVVLSSPVITEANVSVESSPSRTVSSVSDIKSETKPFIKVEESTVEPTKASNENKPEVSQLGIPSIESNAHTTLQENKVADQSKKNEDRCEDGIHCNTPPPTGCTDGIHCGTPPPTGCTDGIHCGTPPPTGCTDGIHCGTPPPQTDQSNADTENNEPPVPASSSDVPGPSSVSTSDNSSSHTVVSSVSDASQSQPPPPPTIMLSPQQLAVQADHQYINISHPPAFKPTPVVTTAAEAYKMSVTVAPSSVSIQASNGSAFSAPPPTSKTPPVTKADETKPAIQTTEVTASSLQSTKASEIPNLSSKPVESSQFTQPESLVPQSQPFADASLVIKQEPVEEIPSDKPAEVSEHPTIQQNIIKDEPSEVPVFPTTASMMSIPAQTSSSAALTPSDALPDGNLATEVKAIKIELVESVPTSTSGQPSTSQIPNIAVPSQPPNTTQSETEAPSSSLASSSDTTVTLDQLQTTSTDSSNAISTVTNAAAASTNTASISSEAVQLSVAPTCGASGVSLSASSASLSHGTATVPAVHLSSVPRPQHYGPLPQLGGETPQRPPYPAQLHRPIHIGQPGQARPVHPGQIMTSHEGKSQQPTYQQMMEFRQRFPHGFPPPRPGIYPGQHPERPIGSQYMRPGLPQWAAPGDPRAPVATQQSSHAASSEPSGRPILGPHDSTPRFPAHSQAGAQSTEIATSSESPGVDKQTSSQAQQDQRYHLQDPRFTMQGQQAAMMGQASPRQRYMQEQDPRYHYASQIGYMYNQQRPGYHPQRMPPQMTPQQQQQYHHQRMMYAGQGSMERYSHPASVSTAVPTIQPTDSKPDVKPQTVAGEQMAVAPTITTSAIPDGKVTVKLEHPQPQPSPHSIKHQASPNPGSTPVVSSNRSTPQPRPSSAQSPAISAGSQKSSPAQSQSQSPVVAPSPNDEMQLPSVSETFAAAGMMRLGDSSSTVQPHYGKPGSTASSSGFSSVSSIVQAVSTVSFPPMMSQVTSVPSAMPTEVALPPSHAGNKQSEPASTSAGMPAGTQTSVHSKTTSQVLKQTSPSTTSAPMGPATSLVGVQTHSDQSSMSTSQSPLPSPHQPGQDSFPPGGLSVGPRMYAQRPVMPPAGTTGPAGARPRVQRGQHPGYGQHGQQSRQSLPSNLPPHLANMLNGMRNQVPNRPMYTNQERHPVMPGGPMRYPQHAMSMPPGGPRPFPGPHAVSAEGCPMPMPTSAGMQMSPTSRHSMQHPGMSPQGIRYQGPMRQGGPMGTHPMHHVGQMSPTGHPGIPHSMHLGMPQHPGMPLPQHPGEMSPTQRHPGAPPTPGSVPSTPSPSASPYPPHSMIPPATSSMQPTSPSYPGDMQARHQYPFHRLQTGQPRMMFDARMTSEEMHQQQHHMAGTRPYMGGPQGPDQMSHAQYEEMRRMQMRATETTPPVSMGLSESSIHTSASPSSTAIAPHDIKQEPESDAAMDNVLKQLLAKSNAATAAAALSGRSPQQPSPGDQSEDSSDQLMKLTPAQQRELEAIEKMPLTIKKTLPDTGLFDINDPNIEEKRQEFERRRKEMEAERREKRKAEGTPKKRTKKKRASTEGIPDKPPTDIHDPLAPPVSFDPITSKADKPVEAGQTLTSPEKDKKKRPRKTKKERSLDGENLENVYETLYQQLMQFPSCPLMEPHVGSTYAICSLAGSTPVGNDELIESLVSGSYGHAKLGGKSDFYEDLLSGVIPESVLALPKNITERRKLISDGKPENSGLTEEQQRYRLMMESIHGDRSHPLGLAGLGGTRETPPTLPPPPRVEPRPYVAKVTGSPDSMISSSSPETGFDDHDTPDFPMLRPIEPAASESEETRTSPTVPLLQPVPVKVPAFMVKQELPTELERTFGDLPTAEKGKQELNSALCMLAGKDSHDKDPVTGLPRQSKDSGAEAEVSVTLTLSAKAAEDIGGVLSAIADLLKIAAPTTYQVSRSPSPEPYKVLQTQKSYQEEALNIQSLSRSKGASCKHCDGAIINAGIRKKKSEIPLLTKEEQDQKGDMVMFCSMNCYVNFTTIRQITHKPDGDTSDILGGSTGFSLHLSKGLASPSDTTSSASLTPAVTPSGQESMETTPIKSRPPTPLLGSPPMRLKRQISRTSSISAPMVKKWKEIRYKRYDTGMFTELHSAIKKGEGEKQHWSLLKMNLRYERDQAKDTRMCEFCQEYGDGESNGTARLLNLDIDKWAHLNCALWSQEVYETLNGALMNVQQALKRGLKQKCVVCVKQGATLGCFKTRCNNIYHVQCAQLVGCIFFEDKTILCPPHTPKGVALEQELKSLVVHRRVYINRDEDTQVANMLLQEDGQHTLRLGSLVLHTIGQLLPHQMAGGKFNNRDFMYPVGYKASRFYWSMRTLYRRCRYVCSIQEADGMPEFKVTVIEEGHPDLTLKKSSCSEVWRQILEPLEKLHKEADLVKVFPSFTEGEKLYGLSDPNIVRLIESLPGTDLLKDYVFKFGRRQLIDLPLTINPTGCARAEPKMRTHFKKPHTLQSSSTHSLPSTVTGLTGDLNSPYMKHFVHSKSQQYRRLKTEWKNLVYLGRSRIQGLGLYAAKDLEMHTMVIEYIGDLIRNEVANHREKIYEAQNRGVYMFRIDNDTVVDATMAGGPARYINHSCDPNCVAEVVEIDKESKIIIITNRRISKGEELAYDYLFDTEDEANKIPCNCGAWNCKKWMN